ELREVVRLPAPERAALLPDASGGRVRDERGPSAEASWHVTPLDLPAQARRAVAAYRAAEPPRALRARDRLSVCG
ncbi:MAG TPA: hypothetical protein VFZ61_00155, partial [Polyangiales bacterium]